MNLVATALIMIVGALCALGMIFAPALVHLARAGLRGRARKIRAGRHHDAHHVPVPAAGGAGGAGHGRAERVQRFGVPAMASTFFNIGSVGFGIVIGFGLGPSLHLSRIEGMADRRGAGRRAAIVLAVAEPASAGLPLPPGLRLVAIPGLVRILRLMVPAILGNAAVQINVMVNTNFASTIYDPRARLRRAGELAELRVPLHAASAGIVRRGDGVGHAALHLAQRRGRATWTNSARRCRNRWGWCFC